MSNVGKWTAWYQGLEEPWPYGGTTSYEIGAAWLAGCARTEDWGCGAGWLSTLIPQDRYRGVDGSASPRCAEVVDLVEYRSTVPGILMRHVLEHNYEWARILDNAVASFTERMALILFTPEQEATVEIALQSDVGVPDIAFRLADITDGQSNTLTCTFDVRVGSITVADLRIGNTKVGVISPSGVVVEGDSSRLDVH